MAAPLKKATKATRTGGGSPPGPTGSSPETPSPDSGPKFWAIPPSEVNGEGLTIAVKDITANPYNDRDLGDLAGLADSIKMDGLLQDIVVMHTEEFAKHYPDDAVDIATKYTLAFGERRWRATQLAGMEEIPAVLRNDVAPKIRRVLFVENFHRKQLSPVEEARKFYRMHHEESMSYREIAAELSLSGPSHVKRRMELMELPKELQQIVGTDDGPGVTEARKIAAELSTPEEQILAWQLVRDEDLDLKDAIRRIHNGEAVPQGNGEPEQRNSEELPPSQKEADDAETSPAEPNEGAPGTKKLEPADTEKKTDGEEQTPKPPASKPTPVKKTAKPPAADRDAAARTHASADRDQTCLHMITKGVELTAEQSDALFARTLLAPIQQGPARTRAHKWLREAGKAGFTISDTDSYFEAVLSSGNADLIKMVTFATALAAGEIRARDGRRQWDRHDAEHVRLLIEAGSHHPESEWERGQLQKFGIPFPVGDDVDADAID